MGPVESAFSSSLNWKAHGSKSEVTASLVVVLSSMFPILVVLYLVVFGTWRRTNGREVRYRGLSCTQDENQLGWEGHKLSSNSNLPLPYRDGNQGHEQCFTRRWRLSHSGDRTRTLLERVVQRLTDYVHSSSYARRLFCESPRDSLNSSYGTTDVDAACRVRRTTMSRSAAEHTASMCPQLARGTAAGSAPGRL